MTKPAKKGDLISWDQVKLDEQNIVVKLRRQQDAV